jgi:hypothetical protein
VPAALDLMLFSNYRQHQHGEPEHLKKRVHSYLHQALQSSNVYLAEALFPYGGATVHLLIKMTRLMSDSMPSVRLLGLSEFLNPLPL